jgi:sugar phosphate isomerase/epimerase
MLALSAAAAAGATFWDAPAILQAAKLNLAADPYGGFPMGAQSYSLRKFSAVQAVRHLQGMGLHYVEFFPGHYPLNSSDQQIAEMNTVLKKAELSPSAHGVSGFTKNHEANRRVFEFAKRAGIKNISANPQPDSFDSLDKLCAEFKIRIAIHNHGPGALYDKISDVVKAVKDHHPLVGACVDTGHFIRSKEDPVKAVHELGPRVFGLHVKDEEKMEQRSRNVIIGSGHLDLVNLFKALKKIKFPADGALSLEYEANADNPIDDMKQCLVAARDAIAKIA